jgi:hypothetical protein
VGEIASLRFDANEQADGSMGVWIRTDCFPAGASLMLEGDKLRVERTDFGLTTSIILPLLGSPGDKELYFFDEASGEKQRVGYIKIF